MQNKKQLAVPMHPLLQYGLGDVFRTMYRKNGWFGKLKDASSDYDITVLLCSHNQYTGQVFKFFDYLNVLNVPWPHRTPNFKGVARKNGLRFVNQKDFGGYTHKDVTMNLGPQEQKQYDKITKKPVIVIHPFAGDPRRMPLNPNKFGSIINNLKSITDSNIVVVGGTYVRGKRLRAVQHKKMKENIVIPEGKGVYNLVGKTTPRLPAKLVENAQCFIGNWSAYCCVAWEKRVPVVMTAGPGSYNTFMRKDIKPTWRYRWHEKCTAVQVRNKHIAKVRQEIATAYLKVTKDNK
jgi:hypothetical protein